MDTQNNQNSASNWKASIAVLAVLFAIVISIIGYSIRHSAPVDDAPVAEEFTPAVTTAAVAEPAVEAPAAPEVKDEFEVLAPPAPITITVVKSWDRHFWAVAENHCDNGYRWKDVAALNPDVPNRRLQVGQVLRLPEGCHADRSAPVSRTFSTPKAPKPKEVKKLVVEPAPVVMPPAPPSVPAASTPDPVADDAEPLMDDVDPTTVMSSGEKDQPESLSVRMPCNYAAMQTNFLMVTKESFVRWTVFCSSDGTIGDDQKRTAEWLRAQLQNKIWQYSFKPGMGKTVHAMRQLAKKLTPEALDGISAFEADRRNTRAQKLLDGVDDTYQQTLAKQPKWVKALFPASFPPTPSEDKKKGDKGVAASE